MSIQRRLEILEGIPPIPELSQIHLDIIDRIYCNEQKSGRKVKSIGGCFEVCNHVSGICYIFKDVEKWDWE